MIYVRDFDIIISREIIKSEPEIQPWLSCFLEKCACVVCIYIYMCVCVCMYVVGM